MNMNRRELLKSASFGTGSVLLAPVLSQIQAQAAASDSQRPIRFVFVVEGNGLPWKQITPDDIKRGRMNTASGGHSLNGNERREFVDLDLMQRTIPESLEPIKKSQEQVTILNGLSGRMCSNGHSNDFGALGAYNARGDVGSSGFPKAETIDVAVGRHLGGIFPRVGLGIVKNAANVVYNCSAYSRGKAAPTTCDPLVAYGNLFGSVAEGAAKHDFLLRTNLLDYLHGETKRLSAQVAGAERHKLDAHLSAYEAMSNRQSRLNEIESTLREAAPVANDKFSSKVESDRLDAQFDIATAALLGGLTSSVTLASGVGNPYFGITFTGLGINQGKHNIGHGKGENGKSASELMTIIRRFHFELIARMMDKLNEVPEGDGTMLDNTVILYLSDAAESHHSRCWEWPFVLIPGKNTGLKAGRYIEYPGWGADGHREICNLYTTLLHIAGDKRKQFGDHDLRLPPTARADGPLPELMV